MNKLKLTSPQYAIFNYDSHGPNFGGGCLGLYDKAHQNINNQAFPSTNYKSVMFENNQ